ncbi:MFS transporter [Pseudooceanicola sp. CBS1P-1]|uniref:MFS transporter n=1 Tax=Pseudooceanicola albus TaxID=2692189 RepID=A0A6L7G0X6_9RHOB|nr:MULTISPECIES: MFS transporter [Pseudooceanicola]MBT9383465.1 MFS transporter [Pseudooceanicola endophyticus]MXN16213.1 MFS transporter [Pseudooceanicola albus]
MSKASAPQRVSAVVEDGLPLPRRTLAFAAVVTTIAMAVLDGAIVNQALPVIAQEQAVSAATVIWAVTAYQLVVVISLLPFAALGERIGFARVYLFGIVLFVVTSALCALSGGITELILARAFQGLAGGALMSINGALMRQIMPRNRLGRGLSGVSMAIGIAAAAGPSLGAGIMAVASWHWLFLINIPIGLLALALGWATLPRLPGTGARFDTAGAALNAVTLGLFITALGTFGHPGSGALALGELLVALVAGVFFLRHMLGQAHPMLPLDLFAGRQFSRSMVCSFCAFFAQFLMLVTLPFYLHDVLGHSEIRTGLLMTPWPVATAIMAPLVGRLADRHSADLLGAIGMAMFGAGFLWVGVLVQAPSDGVVLSAMALSGAGFALFQSPNNRLILSSAPPHRAGGASGMQSTMRLIGQSVGAAGASVLISLSGGVNLEAAGALAGGMALLSGAVSLSRKSGRPSHQAA